MRTAGLQHDGWILHRLTVVPYPESGSCGPRTDWNLLHDLDLLELNLSALPFSGNHEGGHLPKIDAPADLDEQTTEKVRDLARQVFKMAGCSGFARCDFFVEEGEETRILLNEINTIPGFTQTSVYAKLWEATGLPYPDLCDRLVELALDRARTDAEHSF